MINFANVKEWIIQEGDVLRVTRNNVVLWEKQTGPDYTEPFYVQNISNFNESLRINKANEYAPTLTIEYLDGTTWRTLCTTSTTAYTQTLAPGEKLYLRCNTSSWWGSGSGTNNISGISKVGGNIMSLLYGSNFNGTETTFPTNNGYEFNRGIFYGGSSYTKLIDASKLLLPATTLNQYCYYGLFAGCTTLTFAPELPATTLAQSCYNSMFKSCTSLTTAPVLPATTLAQSCYVSMFEGCTSLTTAPALQSTTLAQGCYGNMFKGCTSLTTAPALPATTLAQSCYDGMFWNCTSLTHAPELNAQTLLSFCYDYMFCNCTLIDNIKCLATTGVGQNSSTQMWLANTASSGTFTKAAGVTWSTGNSGIPSGWTVNEQ